MTDFNVVKFPSQDEGRIGEGLESASLRDLKVSIDLRSSVNKVQARLNDAAEHLEQGLQYQLPPSFVGKLFSSRTPSETKLHIEIQRNLANSALREGHEGLINLRETFSSVISDGAFDSSKSEESGEKALLQNAIKVFESFMDVGIRAANKLGTPMSNAEIKKTQAELRAATKTLDLGIT